MRTIRILIADDHEVVRTGLRLVLDQEPDLKVVGEASSGTEALRRVADLRPALVLIDWKMPEMDGVTAAAVLRRQHPGIRILILSGATANDTLLDALGRHVDGFVHKDVSSEHLARAIRAVAAGRTYVDPTVAAAMLRRTRAGDAMASLTGRERDVLHLMATPATYREIGEQLSISEETVRTHAKSILAKLKQPNRTQAVIAALKAGVLSLD